MKQTCKFDKNRDIREVVPDMATDINDAIETGVVRDTGIDSFENGIDEPSGIVGRVEDQFSAIDRQRQISKMLKDARAAADAKAAAKVASAPAAAPASVDAKSE